jgi:hypothetical protein
VFAGSIIGSLWMMSLLGADLSPATSYFRLHKTFQIDGFLTLLVMGVGYMIVPRFRNVQLSSNWLAYLSFGLVVLSLAATILSVFIDDYLFSVLSVSLRFVGISLFACIMIWTIRIHPRLLRRADYFIAYSVITLVTVNLIEIVHQALGTFGNSLSEMQLFLLFPLLMIFGVEYKTLPSLLGFINPKKKLSLITTWLALVSIIIGTFSMFDDSLFLAVAFNTMLLAFVLTFAASVYIFGGFDNSEILRLIQGEKKARYEYLVRHLRISFVFLCLGIVLSIAFSLSNSFIFYDLAIHYTAIGFLGITVALYLPLMLPPITGRMVHFTKFSSLPLMLVIIALAIRTIGDILVTFRLSATPATYVPMISGWLVVIALFVFIRMIHKSMIHEQVIEKR